MTGAAHQHISVCICTFRRPDLLNRLLQALRGQVTEGRFSYSIVVADNDSAESARQLVTELAADSPVEITYCVEPVANIALARNLALRNARGRYAAFIDDDEFPVEDWLLRLFCTCERDGAAGVLGPVLPHFDQEPPSWVRKAGFYDRPRHTTGVALNWRECRTGNVLLRRDMLDRIEGPFRKEFRTGGEDQDFFRRAIEQGHRFIWCDEAVAHEVIPPSRWQRRVLLKRALLRGKDTLRHPRGRWVSLCKSAAAVILYSIALPILFFARYHLFMRYSVKLADHLGRLLAFLGINPICDRPM